MKNIKEILNKEIVNKKVIKFGRNIKNKSDSPSCIFNPRLLLTSNSLLEQIGKELSNRLVEKKIDAIVGVSTSGIPWATACAIHLSKPLLYLRLSKNKYQNHIEGKMPNKSRVALIDDLIFHGHTLSKSIEILNDSNYIVSDVLVLIDRQLEKVDDGKCLTGKYNVNFSSILTMDDIVAYLTSNQLIDTFQKKSLISDYLKYRRHRLPNFVKNS